MKKQSGTVKIHSSGQAPADLNEGRHVVKARTIHNTDYVALDEVSKAVGYNGKWLKDGSYGIGDYDVAYKFRTGDSTAVMREKAVKLPAPAVKEGNRLFVPSAGLGDWLGKEAAFSVEPGQVSFFPKPTAKETGETGATLDFKDKLPKAEGKFRVKANADNQTDNPAYSLLEKAKKYIGVKYDFGAEPYSQSGKFDCSSFTNYLFSQYGVNLPRTADDQAQLGKSVSRDELQAGDLLFFYVPGRFKSNNKVGHVGIYMGDGNMIHSCPEPKDGVQITDINKPFWKETFLSAKRFDLKG
ncbi:peptidoglycan endopeptidase [Cohnella faecalis]|uniref:Peptidoglycan endopeptidase n=2 Tax=Cohnella faecalis TaxID=2315694 RepID=A0A398CSB3_9BACL|nr:peptidoglycan endopeptidase [Cohnella faecalis]